ncbi:hypothetical protein WJX81_003601 [Elliptochloris bilobata]|uniref:Mediator of RNA polymerase II transcription subunit 20 n=1 Tax=Elliptochloris bilobata TaxID=381761 RepID=A0AAW1RJN7_9CHLO
MGGVKCLLRWQHQGALPGRDDFERLCTAVESLAKNNNKRRWQVNCTALKPVQLDTLGGRETPSTTRSGDLFITKFLEAPSTAYMLLRQQRQVMSAEVGLLSSILDKVAPFKARAVLQFDGWAYTVGDFAVCVAKAFMRPGEELRGFMVEVEYLPVQSQQLAQAALQEFVEILQAATAGAGCGLQRAQAPLADFALPARFSPLHAAVQYSSLAAAFLSGRS